MMPCVAKCRTVLSLASLATQASEASFSLQKRNVGGQEKTGYTVNLVPGAWQSGQLGCIGTRRHAGGISHQQVVRRFPLHLLLLFFGEFEKRYRRSVVQAEAL